MSKSAKITTVMEHSNSVAARRPEPNRWGSAYLLISLAFFVLLTVFQGSSIMVGLRRLAQNSAGRPLYVFMPKSFYIYGPFHLAFLVLLLIREGPVARLLQICALIAFSATTTILVTPTEIGGDLVFLLAAVLAYKYGYLAVSPGLKIGALVAIIVAIRTTVIANGALELARAVNQIFIMAAALPIVYWLFEADLIRTQRTNARLEERLQSTAPFAEFGRNVGGVVHDFKNDLAVFTSFGRIVRDSGCAPGSEILDAHNRALDQMHERIRSVLLVTGSQDQTTPVAINVSEMIEAVVYAVRSDQELRSGTSVDLTGVKSGVTVTALPLSLLSLLENTVRNSLESIRQQRDHLPELAGVLTISASVHESYVTITLHDNGTGFGIDCPGNILNCLDPWYTTKGESGGFGLSAVRRAARQLNASVDMRNRAPHGVTTRISIPLLPVGTDAAASDQRS